MNLLIQIVFSIVYAILIYIFYKSIIRILKSKTIRISRFDAIKAIAVIIVFIIILKKLPEGILIILNKHDYSVELFDSDNIFVYSIISLPVFLSVYLGIRINAKMTYYFLTEWMFSWGILIVGFLLILCFGVWAFTDKL